MPHRFDGDVELDDAPVVVAAATDQLSIDAVGGPDDARRRVDGEEAPVARRLFQDAEPQRLDRLPVVPVREAEIVSEVADQAARGQLLEDVILEHVASGRCRADGPRHAR